MRKIFAVILAAFLCIQLTACSNENNASTSTTAVTSTAAPVTTTAAQELTEPEEHGTSEYVDYLYYKAMEDADTATDDDLQMAVNWLKNNTDNIFASQENMELTMYYGELLEHKYKNTGNIYEKVGWQAYKTVKYVYRGVESVSDESTIENLNELIQLLSDATDIV